MLTKENVLDALKEFPESFTIDELIEKLVFKQKVLAGLDQSKKENTFSTDEAKSRLKKWLS